MLISLKMQVIINVILFQTHFSDEFGINKLCMGAKKSDEMYEIMHFLWFRKVSNSKEI